MRRDRDTSSDDDAHVAAAKRPKAFQACITCRKSKVRCEDINGGPISVPAAGSCRRCKLSNKVCSFDDKLPDGRFQSAHQPCSNSVVPIPQPVDSSSNTQAFEDLAQNISARLNIAPNPEESAWDMLQTRDVDCWSVPILALQIAVRSKPSVGRELGAYIRESLEDIVTLSQVQHLLKIYQSNYSPWLDLPDGRNHNPLLVLAKCAVASRHLDNSATSNIEVRIRRAADDAILSQVFDPAPTLSAIHAILILSIWPSTQKLAYESVRDSRLLLASAVCMAQNRHLDSDKEANELKAFGRRLWMSLASFESLLCLGTDRTPTSVLSDISIESIPTAYFATANDIRDTRLDILSRLIVATRRGLAIQLIDVSDVDRWYAEVLQLLMDFERLRRHIAPLSVVSKHERFHSHVLSIYHHSCRLLILQRTVSSAKNIFRQSDVDGPWYKDIRHNGIDFIKAWGGLYFGDAEAILIEACAMSELDSAQLSSAPDTLFALITLAASVAFVTKASYVRDEGRIFPSASDELITITIERFLAVALHPEHAPAKYARLMQVWMKKWEEYKRSFGFLNESRKHVEQHPQAPTKIRPSHSLEKASDSDHFLRLMDPEIHLDNSFWATFMENLSTPGSATSST